MIEGSCRIWHDGAMKTVESINGASAGMLLSWCPSAGVRFGVVRAKLLSVRLAATKSPAIAVIFDDGDSIVRCAPDTLFVLKDRSFKAASELAAGDRMMGRALASCRAVSQVSRIEVPAFDMYEVFAAKHNFLCEGVVIKCRV